MIGKRVDAVALAPAAVQRLIDEMPKAELHLHLDGSMRIDTALQLAKNRDVAAPSTYAGMFDALVMSPGPHTEAQLLAYFTLPVSLMQDEESLARVTRELVLDKAADRVRYCEIRWAPLLHRQRGLTPEQVIGAVADAAHEASVQAGTAVRLTCVAVRSHDPAENVRLATTAGRFLDRGVCGFDLAGDELAFPDPLVHRKAFEAARHAGLHLTVHAGDLPGASESVRRSLVLKPERIAHGVAAFDDIALCQELAERGIVLDLCPTSNVQSGTVPSMRDHPLTRLKRRGVRVTISTDDPTISNVTLSQEYRAAMLEIGLTLPELWDVNRTGLEAAFARQEDLAGVRQEFDEWADAIPELG